MENRGNIKFSNGSEIEVLETDGTTSVRGRTSEIFWAMEEYEEIAENDEIL